MQLEVIGRPIKYRLKTGEEVLLRPGVPMDVPDYVAAQLLRKAPDYVRKVAHRPDNPIVLEPAAPTARPIYWESMDGSWHGPVTPEYLGKTGSAHNERFWVIVDYHDSIRWIRADLLRSRRAFEVQRHVPK